MMFYSARGGALRAKGTDHPRALLSHSWLPPGLWWLAAAIALCFGWGPNFGLFVLSLAVLMIGSAMCWRPGEPAIIFFLFAYQWLQASIGIFAANFMGKTVDELALHSNSNMGGATALTLIGLLALFGALRATSKGPIKHLSTVIRYEAKALPTSRLAAMYFIAAIAALAFTAASTYSEGLRQPLLAFATVKWAAFIVVAYAAFIQGGRTRDLFLVIFSIEFVFSLGGYFSSFQQVFVYTFIAALGANKRISGYRAGLLSFLIVTAIALGIVWTAVKAEYRTYLNGGSGKQEITVSWIERTKKLAELATSVPTESLQEASVDLVARVTYVEFFGAAMNYVPAVKEHTLGEIWGRALLHPLTPRMLFPDKPITDASSQTRDYTGVQVAGWEQGTQISIGYFGESYIDFGYFGMMLPLVAYGLVAGAMYRSILMKRHFRGLIGAAFAVPLLMGGALIGQSTEKLVGSLVITYLAVTVIHRFFGREIRIRVLGASAG